MPITVLYARSLTLTGLIIRHRDPYGRWSHCAVDTGEGTAIEARYAQGVIETRMDDFLLRYGQGRVEAQQIECPSPQAGIAWGRSQIGRGYDFLSVIGLGLRASWQSADRWQCAELVEAVLANAGRDRFRSARYRITPNTSWMVK